MSGVDKTLCTISCGVSGSERVVEQDMSAIFDIFTVDDAYGGSKLQHGSPVIGV